MPNKPTSASTLSSSLRLFFLARPTWSFLTWGAVNRALKTHIAKAAVATLCDGDDFARCEQLEQDIPCLSVGDDGAHRHFEGDVIARMAEHIGAQTVLAALGLMATGKTKVNEGVEVGVCNSKHMSATSAVTSVRAAEFFVLFVAKRDAAVPAVTCGDVDIGFVNELHGVSSLKSEKPRRAGLLR